MRPLACCRGIGAQVIQIEIDQQAFGALHRARSVSGRLHQSNPEPLGFKIVGNWINDAPGEFVALLHWDGAADYTASRSRLL